MNSTPVARELVTQLLRAGRRNDFPEPPPEPDTLRLPLVQHPTLAALEEAAACRR